jgi:DNA processing protein
MTGLNESWKAWHSLISTRGIGPKRAAKIMLALSESGIGLPDALRHESKVLTQLGLEPDLLDQLMHADEGLIQLGEFPDDIQILTPEDERYPIERIDPELPLAPILYVVGNLHLLRVNGIAISGSRSASIEMLQYVQRLGRCVAERGWNIVSGHAAGVDEAAHSAALAASGTTTIVAAEGLLNFKPKAGLDLSDSDSFLLISQFEPSDRWNRFRAMERNTTIAALSDAVVVVAADTKGGSWAQGNLCLKTNKPLFVPDVPPEVASGNRRLIELGAIPLDPKSPEHAVENIASLDSEKGTLKQLRLLS